jgi:CHAT domain-containing protein
MPFTAAAPDATADDQPISLCVAPSLAMVARRADDSPLAVTSSTSLAQAVNPSEDSSLPCCLVEARIAAEAFVGNVVPLRGRMATRERVLDALANADIFHFLGHAFVDWNDPLDSALVCAARKNDSGLLTLREILGRLGAIRTKVILLSACQIGHVQPGGRQNDFLNLPAALVAAGARTVVAPRWQVDDLATSLLLSKMMAAWLRDHLPIPRALAAARRWLREEVTTDMAVGWLEDSLADPLVDREALRRRQRDYTDRYDPADHPFAGEQHWGAFEVIGSPTP